MSPAGRNTRKKKSNAGSARGISAISTALNSPDAAVHHPPHYGGENNPYEAIKVIEAWGLGFNLGNTIKYISRAERKGTPLQDLEKAAWYLNREIENRSK